MSKGLTFVNLQSLYTVSTFISIILYLGYDYSPSFVIQTLMTTPTSTLLHKLLSAVFIVDTLTPLGIGTATVWSTLLPYT